MTRNQLSLTITASLLLLGACSTMQATTDYDSNVDFGRYHTYRMTPGQVTSSYNTPTPNTLVADRIKTAIETQLGAKGLAPTQDRPDLLVGYVAGARTRLELETSAPYAPSLTPYWGPGWWGPQQAWVDEYQHGTLVIDLVDASTSKLVWRSIVEADRNDVVDLGKAEAIQKAVRKAFQSWPAQKD
jgi:hypothetical protein